MACTIDTLAAVLASTTLKLFDRMHAGTNTVEALAKGMG
jgi:hypothetical protein